MGVNGERRAPITTPPVWFTSHVISVWISRTRAPGNAGEGLPEEEGAAEGEGEGLPATSSGEKKALKLEPPPAFFNTARTSFKPGNHPLRRVVVWKALKHATSPQHQELLKL
jgi:hypothetical protein